MKCPVCNKEVYFAEKVASLGKNYHRQCHRCEKCKKTLEAGAACENLVLPVLPHTLLRRSVWTRGVQGRRRNGRKRQLLDDVIPRGIQVSLGHLHSYILVFFVLHGHNKNETFEDRVPQFCGILNSPIIPNTVSG